MPYVYPNRRARLTDFWVGFAGWFAVNALAIGLLFVLGSSAEPGGGSVLFLLNLGVPIVLAYLRPMMAFGIVLAFANLLVLVVVLGIFETAADFTQIGRPSFSPTPLVGFGLVGVAAFAVASYFVMRRMLRGL